MNTCISLFTFFLIPFVLLSSQPQENELIPRTEFFGNPALMSVKISDDGNYLSYLAPLIKEDQTSKLNIWIRSRDKADDRPLTDVTDRSIDSYFWSDDSTQIFYLKDNKGDENWRLYGINLATKETTCYTPFDKVQTRLIPHAQEDSDFLLLGLNKDNPEIHDVYLLNVKTKELSFVMKNPGKVIQWIADDKLCIRAGLQMKEDGGRQIIYRKDSKTQWSVIKTYDLDDSHSCYICGFSDKHNLIYLCDSHNSNTIQIVACNPDTKECTAIANDPEYDMSGLFMNKKTEEVEAVYCEREKAELRPIKEGVCSRIVKAFEPFNKSITISSGDKEYKKWIVTAYSDTSPATYYLYNDEDQSVNELFKARPNLKELLSPMKPITFKSRDGLTIHGYLTIPQNKQTPLPLIVLVHGGPELRDSWGYNSQVQWLANRGYAVLQINYRGSSGYGKKFIQAAYREWGGKMHDDLIDGVNWAIEQKIADPKKVAIYGGSYGGYAALVGATFTPDVFCCAIDVVGISNLITNIKSYPPYWKVFLERQYKMVGNPETEEEFLKSRSPLFKVDAIKIPLFIAHGGKDPRVPQEESEQIVAELKKRNIAHEYLLFPEEGHGFRNADNRLRYYKKAEAFLAQHVGGRFEQ